jgi:putative flippase GtrA
MTKTFTRFIIIGLVSTAINYATFYALYALNIMHYAPASAIGYCTGLVVGYFFNKAWTFEVSQHSVGGITKYISTYMASLVLGLGILTILVDTIGLPAWFSNILVIGVTTITNYCGLKFWAFKEIA